MDNHTDKNLWVDEVMESLNGLQRVKGNPDMCDNVLRRINDNKRNNDKVRVLMPRIAAAAVLLLVINIASMIHATHIANSASKTQQQGVYQAVNESISSLSEDSF